MADNFKTRLEIDTALPFHQPVAISQQVIANRTFAGKVLRSLPDHGGDGHHYQIGDNKSGSILNLWPTKAGGAGLEVSELTIDEATGDFKDGLVSTIRVFRRMSKLNKAVAPSPEFCVAFRDEVVVVDPTATATLVQE